MIKINNFSFSFENWKKYFPKWLNLTIKEWEKISLVGRSWYWKTTLLSFIWWMNLKNINYTWSVEVTNKNLKIRMVFQNNILLPWFNVFDNILISITDWKLNNKQRQIHEKHILDNLDKIWLKWYDKHFPHELSVWMKQRVNFIRAILTEPDILLLDEPFSSLDEKNKQKLVDILNDYYKRKNVTSIFVTHSKYESKHLTDKIFDITLNKFIYEI